MKRSILQFSAAILVASVLFACQKDMSGTLESDETVNESASLSNARVSFPCGQMRTQTQGGWGSTPSGNNPGTYLRANFTAAFGEFLTVGCYPDNFYVKLTSAQAVTTLLPVGGPGSVLTSSPVNPVSLKNVLVGQLVALKLSVTFDGYDANFGGSSIALGDMIIGSGTFKDYSVADFLAIGEQVLGGCNTEFTPQQIVETASSINENYVDGTTNKGFLVCPDSKPPPPGDGNAA